MATDLPGVIGSQFQARAFLQVTANAGISVLQFAASIVAGLLFGPGKSLADSLRAFESRVISQHAIQFVELANATVQNVARGVIGVALLQAIFSPNLRL